MWRSRAVPPGSSSRQNRSVTVTWDAHRRTSRARRSGSSRPRATLRNVGAAYQGTVVVPRHDALSGPKWAKTTIGYVADTAHLLSSRIKSTTLYISPAD